MEGFDLSRSLHSAFAPIDNDAYKWQRIFDTRLQWQMQNEKEKNDLKRLRISDATKQMGALSGLQLDIIPGAEQEYAQSVLTPIKEAVNEIYGGLMSGQDSEYYLEEAGNVFNYVHNLLNKDERLRDAIRHTSILNISKANTEKLLQDKEKFSMDGFHAFQKYYNKELGEYNKGSKTLGEFASAISSFDTQTWGSLSKFTEMAQKLAKDISTTQTIGSNITEYKDANGNTITANQYNALDDNEKKKYKPKLNIGMQTHQERVNNDKVNSLLISAINSIGGNIRNIIQYQDEKGNTISVNEFNDIKDGNHKKKYKAKFITNSLDCGDDIKCQRVIGEVASVLPGYTSEQTINKSGEAQIAIWQAEENAKIERGNATYKQQQKYDQTRYEALLGGWNKRIGEIQKAIASGNLSPEKEKELKDEIQHLTQMIVNSRNGKTTENLSDQGTFKSTNINESNLGTADDPSSDDFTSKFYLNSVNETLMKTIGKDISKEQLRNNFKEMFLQVDDGNTNYISYKDKNGVHLKKEFSEFLDNLVEENLTKDQLQTYKDQGLSYEQIFNDLYSKVKPGFWESLGNKIGRFVAPAGFLFGVKTDDLFNTIKDNLDLNSLSESALKRGEVTRDILDKNKKEYIQNSQLERASGEAQINLKRYFNSLSSTSFSSKDGKEINKSDVDRIIGLNFVGDNIYIRAVAKDENGNYVEQDLAVDNKTKDIVLDGMINIMNGVDANNPSRAVYRNTAYDPKWGRSNYSVATNRVISGLGKALQMFKHHNSIPLSDRFKLPVTNKDGAKKVMEYTGGSFPIEISYGINKNDNSVNDIVEVRAFRYKKDGSKEYYGERPYYFNLKESGNNIDKINRFVYESVINIDITNSKQNHNDNEDDTSSDTNE